jgi:hypothetical protein
MATPRYGFERVMSDALENDVERARDLEHHRAMQERQAQRRAERAERNLSGGLLLVLTGPGKGKSSSGFGMVARALGWDMRVGIVQFIKGKWRTGERQFFERFPDLVTYEVMGEGSPPPHEVGRALASSLPIPTTTSCCSMSSTSCCAISISTSPMS